MVPPWRRSCGSTHPGRVRDGSDGSNSWPWDPTVLDMMERVLVTGATGFIGRHCLPVLSTKAVEVHAVSSRPIPDEARTAIWHRVDLLDPREASHLVAKLEATHLLHFAWITEPGEYWTSADNSRWVEASLSLVRAFARHRGQRVVIAGSCAEYDWSGGWCSETDTPLLPATPYGISKNSLRLKVDALARQTGLSTAWGRIFHAYGPYEKPGRFVPSVILPLIKGQPARCRHGDHVRDFLHVSDIADAFVTLLESPVCGPLNIGSGSPVSLRDVAIMIGDKLGCSELVQFDPTPEKENAPPLIAAKVDRLRGELAWTPQYDLDRGLNQMILWCKSQSRFPF